MFFSRPPKRFIALTMLAVMALSSLLLVAARPIPAFPEVIPLPNGFQPEGVAAGHGNTFYVGSIPTGAIFRGDIRTGTGSILVPGQAGHSSIGIKLDSRTNLLYVAGGGTGKAFVYNAKTGANVAAITLTTSTTTFINDEIVTPRAVYFTDSLRPVFYRVALGRNGALPNPPVSQEISLGGDFTFVGNGALNSNGIEATPGGKALIIVSTTLGTLYRVDPKTGVAKLIDLGGGNVLNGDGILLKGQTLYVVQNFLNQVAVVRLNEGFTAGKVVRTVTNSNLDVPSTIARFGESFYVVNARFDITPTPDTPYQLIRVIGER